MQLPTFHICIILIHCYKGLCDFIAQNIIINLYIEKTNNLNIKLTYVLKILSMLDKTVPSDKWICKFMGD